MPETSHFSAEGRENGFPFCPTRVDVDGLDYWITLGGFRKGDGGSPTNNQIALSRQNAMRLFWNLYGIRATSGTTGSIFLNPTTAYQSEKIPRNRLCELSTRNTGSEYLGYELYGSPQSGLPSTQMSIAVSDINRGLTSPPYRSPIVSLYSGGDFVGFGVGGGGSASNPQADFFVSLLDRPTSSGEITLNLVSYWSFPTSVFPEQDLDYTEMPIFDSTQTIPLVCRAYSTGTSPSSSRDASNRSATNGGFTYTLDSLDFYTYPA